MAPSNKDETFKFRLTAAEKQMMLAVSEHSGLSYSDVIRQGIRRQYAELPPKARTKK